MCHQSVGLIQGVIEESGIPTVSISNLLEVTRKVNPPRVLFVDTPLGYPLGEPNQPRSQIAIVKAALGLLESTESLPLVRTFHLP